MPALELMDEHTPIVLWPFSRRDSHGEIRVGAAVQLYARIVRRRVETQTAQGNPVTLDAQIATDRTISLDSIAWEGETDDLPTGTSFNWDTDGPLYQVVNRSIAEDLKGRSTRYEYGLVRYKGNLPEAG